MQNINKIKYNSSYAPGIATYGIDGLKGDNGNDGNNIYFTDLPIEAEKLNSVITQKIQDNELLIKNSNKTIYPRKYQNGDYFFNENGAVYMLKNIDSLSQIEGEGETSNIYFDLVCVIKQQDVSSYFNYTNNRLSINSQYNGFDIIDTTNLSNENANINTNAALNIISNNIIDNKINLLYLNSLNNQINFDNGLTIYYDTTTNTYHFKSNNKIVLDANVIINNDQLLENTNEYSSVLTSNDTITYFKYLCDKIYININEKSEVDSNISLTLTFDNNEIFQKIKYINDNISNIYVKVYLKNISYCYLLFENINIINENELTITIPIPDVEITTDILMVSLLHNIEIFLKNKKENE